MMIVPSRKRAGDDMGLDRKRNTSDAGRLRPSAAIIGSLLCGDASSFTGRSFNFDNPKLLDEAVSRTHRDWVDFAWVSQPFEDWIPKDVPQSK